MWTRKHTKLDAMKLLGEAGLPAGAVLDTDELNKDVTFEQRGVMQTMIHPVHRPFKMPGWPVRVDGKATRITSSPMLGEHTDQVLSEWLGLNGPGGGGDEARRRDLTHFSGTATAWLRPDSAEPRCRGPVPAVALAFSTLSVGRGRALRLTTLRLCEKRTAARQRRDERCSHHQARCAHAVLQMSTAYLRVDAADGAEPDRGGLIRAGVARWAGRWRSPVASRR